MPPVKKPSTKQNKSKPASRRTTVVNSPILSVTEMTDGDLTCSIHRNQQWCLCKNDFIQNHMDARDSAGVSIVLPGLVNTPIIPTNGWWIKTMLRDPENHGVRMAYIIHSLNVTILGYLCPGEGRAVIREMFLDWLHGEMKKADGIKCTSPTHRPPRSSNRTLAQQMQEAWMLLENGLCADCSQYLDFESDVPED